MSPKKRKQTVSVAFFFLTHSLSGHNVPLQDKTGAKYSLLTQNALDLLCLKNAETGSESRFHPFQSFSVLQEDARARPAIAARGSRNDSALHHIRPRGLGIG